MNLVKIINDLLVEQVIHNIQLLKDKYVGSGKPMSEKDFEKILDVSMNKFYLIAWLSKRVGSGMIKTEDIYKYKEYFEIFEKNKNKFEFKDINLYKTADDLQKFLQEVIDVREGDIVFDEIAGKDNFVSPSEIQKLESTDGAKYLGVFDNVKMKYQVFQIFGVNKETWKLYRDILGKCKGRARGARIDICTIGSYQYFKDYLTDPKGSSYFVLYNLDDPKSPYQLHYESGQFMDKNDNSNIGINQIKFYEFVSDRVPQYSLENENFPGEIEVPIRGKGFQDERKRKQGLWKSFERGKVRTIVTYVNGKEIGPFVVYYSNGQIMKKGNRNSKEVLDGEYVEYYKDGEIQEKGTWNNGNRVGVWIFGYNNGQHKLVDYTQTPSLVSGLTKNDILKYVSSTTGLGWSPSNSGPTINYFPSGQVKSIGVIGTSGNLLGEWTLYFPDGSIRLQGKFIRGNTVGEWINVIKMKEGRYIFVANYDRGSNIVGKVKVYDKDGKYLKSIKKEKDLPDEFFKSFEDLYNSIER